MRRIILIAGLLVLLILSGADAQSRFQWQAVASGGYTYKTIPADPMKSRFYTLKNGLTVILTVNRKEPRVATLFAVRTGSKTDPSNHTGLAHYLEHMMFKGTDQYGTRAWVEEKPLLDSIDLLYEKYNHSRDTADRTAIYRDIDQVSGAAAKFAIANEYDKMMASMGGHNSNAFTSVEETVYTEDIPSGAIDKFIALQAERFRSPVFRIFHTELEAVYEEKNLGLDDDGEKVEEKLMAGLFPKHNYGQQTTIGTIEHLKNPSLLEIKKYYQANYVPNNMGIIMAGDFDADYVIAQIDQHFGYMEPRPLREYKPPPEKPIAAPLTKEVWGPDAEMVAIGFRLPGGMDRRSVLLAGTLLNLLYNGKAGLIDLNLNKRQVLLSASASLNVMKDYAVLELSGNNKTDQTLQQARDSLIMEIKQIRDGRFDETMIQAAVDNAKLSYLMALDDNSSRVGELLDPFVISKTETWPSEVSKLEEMSKLTKKDIVEFATKWLGNNYVCIYKRIGEDKSVLKIKKPPITPIEVNRDEQSDFLKKVNAMNTVASKPQWLDYTKDFTRIPFGITQLLYVQNSENEIFRLRYRLNMGSYNNKLLSLAAQYLEFLRTDRLSPNEISKQFYNLACSYSISVGTEFTTITITGLQKNMEKSVSLLEHILTNCQPDEMALGTLKARILKARANSKLNKEYILTGLEYYAMYGEKNPFNNQLTSDELNQLDANQLVDVLHHFTQFEHLVIYYGPLAQAAAQSAIARIHRLPAIFLHVQGLVEFAKSNQQENSVLFVDYDMVQVQIAWLRNTAEYSPRYTTLIDLFNEYYGGGMGSVVYQTLRESKALAYDTYTIYMEPSKQKERYTMLGYIGCQADKLDEAIEGMKDLLNHIPEAEKLLETCKKSIRISLETDRYMQDAVINKYLADLRKGLDRDLRKDVYDHIDKISYKELQQFAKENISNKPYTYCIVGSEKKINIDSLAKYGTVKKISLEEIFGY